MNTILFVGQHPRTYGVRWHSHSHWELVYCTGGEGAFLFENGTRLPYRAGVAAAIPPGERHANASQEGFTNIFLTIEEPSFPFRGAFAVEDDAEGHLLSAFSQARKGCPSPWKQRGLGRSSRASSSVQPRRFSMVMVIYFPRLRPDTAGPSSAANVFYSIAQNEDIFNPDSQITVVIDNPCRSGVNCVWTPVVRCRSA